MNPVADIPNVSVVAPALEELMPQLLRLSANARLEVITRLSQSLQSIPTSESVPPAKPTMLDFAGAWATMPGTDEEIIATVRNARNFTRPEIAL